MIILSIACVIVSAVLLVAGVVSSELPLVYGAAGGAVVALIALAVGLSRYRPPLRPTSRTRSVRPWSGASPGRSDDE